MLGETVQKAVEGERWPPVLKVEEFDLYDLVEPFLRRFDFEVDPLLYPFDNALPLHMCVKFLKQVRESWGYDVNVVAPGSPFFPIHSSILKEKCGLFEKIMAPDLKSLVDKINNEAKEHGKFYVFDEIKKAVGVSGGRHHLITFTVREVSSNKLERVRVCYFDVNIVQWSFKGEGEGEGEDEDIFLMPAGCYVKGRWIYA